MLLYRMVNKRREGGAAWVGHTSLYAEGLRFKLQVKTFVDIRKQPDFLRPRGAVASQSRCDLARDTEWSDSSRAVCYVH